MDADTPPPAASATAAASPAPSADASGAPPPRRTRAVGLPGGSARLVAEVAVAVGGRPGEELVVQALEDREGGPLLRLGYRRDGRTLRGPVTATAAEAATLLRAAAADPVVGWALARCRPA